MSGGVTCELVAWAAARVDWLREGLLGWFERFGRCFPWREPGRSAYEVTVAEILLQRTTAAQVAQVYPDFLRRYPAWDSLARATPAELKRVMEMVLAGGQFGYRFVFPAMRVGRHEVYWHRPLAAFRRELRSAPPERRLAARRHRH